jgi:hypothetical protein
MPRNAQIWLTRMVPSLKIPSNGSRSIPQLWPESRNKEIALLIHLPLTTLEAGECRFHHLLACRKAKGTLHSLLLFSSLAGRSDWQNVLHILSSGCKRVWETQALAPHPVHLEEGRAKVMQAASQSSHSSVWWCGFALLLSAQSQE